MVGVAKKKPHQNGAEISQIEIKKAGCLQTYDQLSWSGIIAICSAWWRDAMPTELTKSSVPDSDFYDPNCRSIRDVLEVVHHTPSGRFSWCDGGACPLGAMADVAEAEGLIRHWIMGWDGIESFTLTASGRAYLDLPPTLTDRLGSMVGDALNWIAKIGQ